MCPRQSIAVHSSDGSCLDVQVCARHIDKIVKMYFNFNTILTVCLFNNTKLISKTLLFV